MPRIRTIKPSFWEDEKVGALPFGARLLFLCAINLADDVGRLRWSTPYLKASAFMYDDVSFEEVRRYQGALTESSLITHYWAGEDYAEIVNFTKHQTINRPSAFRYPAPDSEEAKRLTSGNDMTHVKLPEDSRRTHGVLSEGSPQEGEGEREGKDSLPFGESPRARARTREARPAEPELRPATVPGSISAADVVAAWIDATNANGVSPTSRSKGMVAKEAKSLLDSGNEPDRVLRAAVDAGIKGFPNLERELMAMSGRAIPKRIANKPSRDDKVRALLELAQREENRDG